MFESYDEEVTQLKKEIKQLTDSLTSSRGEDREREVRQAQEAIEQARELIEKMDVEAGGNSKLEARVEGLKKEVQGIEAMFKKTLSKVQYDIERGSLLGSRSKDLELTSRDHQTRYADTTAQLDSHSGMIHESIRTTEQTIGMAQEVLGSLADQRGVLQHASGNITAMNTNIGEAGRTMRAIARRLVTNKIILVLVAVAILLGIFGIIYVRWFWGVGFGSS